MTLPNIFNAMSGGLIWGTLFFIFLSFASLTTVIAVFENIISYSVDVWGMPRGRAHGAACPGHVALFPAVRPGL